MKLTAASFFNQLTLKELTHLQDDAGVNTLAAFKRTREQQIAMGENSPIETCWDCRLIAQKVGLE